MDKSPEDQLADLLAEARARPAPTHFRMIVSQPIRPLTGQDVDALLEAMTSPYGGVVRRRPDPPDDERS